MIFFLIEWDEKLNVILNPEDSPWEKIEKGVFGKALQIEGAESVLKKTQTLVTLIGLMNSIEDIEDKNQTFEEWNRQEKDNIRDILKENEL